jgi:hypothetical protein
MVRVAICKGMGLGYIGENGSSGTEDQPKVVILSYYTIGGVQLLIAGAL